MAAGTTANGRDGNVAKFDEVAPPSHVSCIAGSTNSIREAGGNCRLMRLVKMTHLSRGASRIGMSWINPLECSRVRAK